MEENYGAKAARPFDTDLKRIRYWKKQKRELLLADEESTASWRWEEES